MKLPIFIRRVHGKSMEPALRHDDIVVAYSRGGMKVGRVVIADVDGREIIKRVADMGELIELRGDNPEFSTDSRQFGAVAKTAILGTVIMKLRPVNSTPPPAFTHRFAPIYGWAMALMWFVTVVTTIIQLEVLIRAIQQNVIFAQSVTSAKIYSGLLIFVIVFSIPFLTRLQMSPLARICSVFCTIAAPLFIVSFVLASYTISMTAVIVSGLLVLANSIALMLLNARSAFASVLVRK